MHIPRNVFSMHKLTDPGSLRFSMGGVRFERPKPQDEKGVANPLAIACDGRRLLVLSWSENKLLATKDSSISQQPVHGFSTILPVQACKDAAKLAKPSKTDLANRPYLGQVILDEPHSNGTVPIYGTDDTSSGTITPKALDGRFPDWRGMCAVYTQDNSLSVQLDARLLAEMLQVMAEHCCDQVNNSVTLTVPMKLGAPATVTAADSKGNKAFGVLMPLSSPGPDGKPAHPAQAWHPSR